MTSRSLPYACAPLYMQAMTSWPCTYLSAIILGNSCCDSWRRDNEQEGEDDCCEEIDQIAQAYSSEWDGAQTPNNCCRQDTPWSLSHFEWNPGPSSRDLEGLTGIDYSHQRIQEYRSKGRNQERKYACVKFV